MAAVIVTNTGQLLKPVPAVIGTPMQRGIICPYPLLLKTQELFSLELLILTSLCKFSQRSTFNQVYTTV